LRFLSLNIKNIFIISTLVFFTNISFCIGQGLNNDQGEILESMVVVSKRVDDYIRKSPNLTIIMDSSEIKQSNFLHVYEAIDTMPGIDIKPGSTGLGARISIRGGGGSGSVLVLIDGRPMTTSQYGGIDLGSIPIDIVKKIIVFKPPVPSWLGPGASAGAIYIELKHTKADIGYDNNGSMHGKPINKGFIRVAAGSYGLVKISATLKTKKDENRTLLAIGYGHKKGKRANSHQDKGYINFLWNKGDSRMSGIEINGKYYISDHGVTGPLYNPTPDASQKYERASLSCKYIGVIKDEIDYNTQVYTNITRLKDKSQTSARAKMNVYTFGGVTNFLWSSDDETKDYRAGGSFENTSLDHTLTGRHDRSVFSMNSVANFKYNPIAFVLGIRGDYVSDFDFSPAGNTGVSYSISDQDIVKFNMGYSENLPSFSQLYQPSHGSMDQVRGNPDLDKEKILSLNLCFTHIFLNKSQIDLALFRTKTRNLIRYFRGNDLISRPANIDNAIKQGVETSLKLKVSKALSFDFNYIWQHSENKENHKELSYAPTHTFKITSKTKLGSGLRFETITRAYSRQFTDTANTDKEKITRYFTTDIKLIKPLILFNCPGEFFINGINVFNRHYNVHYGYPDDGIRFLCGMGINF